MTFAWFSALIVLAGVVAIAAAGERRRREDNGRLSKRQLLKYR
jgi:uncharacterized BrkB/YihY/UPF0761 family membrane protein